MKNMRKIVLIIVAVISLALMVFGIAAFQVDNCGCSNHGGWLDIYCNSIDIPLTGRIVMIVLGGLGILVSACIAFVLFKKRSSDVSIQNETNN